MMPSISFDAALPFGTDDERQKSENVLLTLLGAMAMRNLTYLHQSQAPLLYDSGVKYFKPDQLLAPDVSQGQQRDLVKMLRSWNVPDDSIVGCLREIGGKEKFRDIPGILDRGGSDCNDLACWRVAELWQIGVKASPYLDWQRNTRGGITYHALVQWPDGSTEDPSIMLGMSGRPGELEGEIEKNQTRAIQAAQSGLNSTICGVVLGSSLD